MLSRAAAARRLARAHGLPLLTVDFRRGLRSGRCARRRCDSRLSIVRVTLDLRDPSRQDWSAVRECVQCGNVWSGARVPEMRLDSTQGQSTLLTILTPPPAGQALRAYRTRANAMVRTVGVDARTLRNATYRDLARELEDWRARSDRFRARKGRAQDRALAIAGEERIARDVEPAPDMSAAMARLRALQDYVASLQETP